MNSRQTIMIVDDTEMNIAILVEALQDTYEVIVAINGLDAIELLKYQKPDLILLDIIMPVMDGYDVLTTIKKNSEVKNIPVILLSAMTDSGSKTKGFSLGAVDYVTKPFEIIEVKARVKTQLRLEEARLVLVSQNIVLEEDKADRAAELVVANKELAYQNGEKADRAAELIIANKELVFQGEEKGKRAAELVIANKELAFQNEEKDKRVAELIIANKKLENEIKNRIDMEEKIKNLAYYDYLTGLPNKRLFDDRLNLCILDSVRYEKSLGVLFLDLDSFKRINDTMGHAKGDELLKMFSKRLTNILRVDDTVCRVGGDEFLILIKNLKQDFYLEKIAEKILDIFKKPFIIDNQDLFVATSIGGAIYPIDGEDVETLIKNADIAMYKAKEKGKNNFQLCTPIIKDSLGEEMKLTNSLYGALERNELELYYQPQVNIISGEIIGLEALIRWHNIKLGIVNPGDFIYIAEKTGLILPIGEWAMRSACSQNKTWQNAGILNVPIAVNLSVNQFQNIKIVEQITKILTETNLNPKDLELEITENIIMKEPEYIIESLKQLKELGVTIAIDDFGTEYSSLNYIKQLPVDKIKIAMTFIQGININHKDEAIIKVIIVLAKNLGLKVIAEGVETKEQLDFLRDQMCDEIQGYYYYKPMTANQIEELIAKG